MKKLFTALFATIFVVSCNLTVPGNNPQSKSERNTLINPDNRTGEEHFNTKSFQPQIVTFGNNVTYQSLSSTPELPATEYIELPFKTRGSMRDAVRMPESGSFRLVIRVGSQFQITDNDATDGMAVVEVPQGMYEGYLTVLRDSNGKDANPSITLKDELYYIQEDLKELETTKGGWRNLTGDNWYQLGGRAFPVPQELSRINNNYADMYVLDFNNNGVKDLLFRWYKSDRFDYPLGTKVIGNAGGNIELPGVGKVEIPQGALSQDTVISLRQELQGYEFIEPVNGIKTYDYASPLLRIEPQGLTLNEPAKAYLETYISRLGNNTPYVIEYFKTQDKKNWDSLNYYLSDIHNLEQGSPAVLDELNFVAKHIPSHIQPTDNYEVEIFPIENSENTFNIAATQTIDIGNNIILTWKPDQHEHKNEVLNEIKKRMNLAYAYFRGKSGLDPGKTKNIIMSLVYNNLPYLGEPITIGNYMRVPGALLGLEHELWHVFQFQVESLLVRGFTNDGFLFESAAEYMGASVFEKKTAAFTQGEQMKTSYLEKLRDGLTSINQSLPYSNKYWGVGFITYLASKYGEEMMINVIKNKAQYIKDFHDYSLYAYTQEKFNIYPPENYKFKQEYIIDKNVLQTKNLLKTNTTTSPLRFHSGTTGNHSAHYYKIKHDKTAPDNKHVSIKPASSSCTLSNLKLKVLYYKNENALPTDEHDKEEITLTGINNWTKLNSFDKDKYSHFVLIVSNSDGQFHPISNPSCNSVLDIGYTETAAIPGRNSNIIMKVDGADIKLDGNFSYRNSSNQVLNITSFTGLNSIASIGSAVGGSVVSGQPGKDISRHCPDEDKAKSKRSGSLSLSLSFPTELDLSRKKVNGEIVTVNSKTIAGTITGGSYEATDKPVLSTRTGDCSNWSSWGYDRCYVVGNINGTATLTYSGGSTATVSGDFTGNGKYTQGGYWGCSYSDTVKNGAPFTISESFSFTIPVTEKSL